MSNAVIVSKTVLILAALACVSGCDDDKPEEKAAPKATATAAPKPAAPVASAVPEKPKHDCPEGSTGMASFDKPCDAKDEAARMMEVTWTGKMDDKGPSFRVVNTSKTEINYGKMSVYFYDKAGKQLDVKDGEKTQSTKSCGGNIFDGPMKAGEKAVITFSCIKKDDVPEGVDAIQAEMEMVGFTDEDGKKNAYYWRNKALTPKARPKAKAKKK
jgi:hypothetical protein